ncbi:MAG: hypothetical protein HQL99_08605 [Magnetococcales bacterium]|nr:hypothetical protein [Magnetococcales bacterium]
MSPFLRVAVLAASVSGFSSRCGPIQDNPARATVGTSKLSLSVVEIRSNVQRNPTVLSPCGRAVRCQSGGQGEDGEWFPGLVAIMEDEDWILLEDSFGHKKTASKGGLDDENFIFLIKWWA